jgi:uncharacterized membrane protein (UPF0127 family)
VPRKVKSSFLLSVSLQCTYSKRWRVGLTNSERAIAAILGVVIVVSIFAGYLLLRPANTPASAVEIKFAGVILNVELAKTPQAQQMGLSGRVSMPPDHGMLFIFDSESNWGFWMKDMKFSLDIIWFDSNRRAVYIEQNLAPCTPQSCPIYSPPTIAMYVLEVNAGFIQVHNVTLGDAFSFV